MEIEFLSNRPTRNGAFRSNGTIVTTWLSLFQIVQPNLSWDDNGNVYWIRHSETCVAVGSSLVQEVMSQEAGEYFKLSENTLRKITAYYIEAGLMNPPGSSEAPFPEIAERIARRHHFAKTSGPAFQLVSGEARVTQPETGGFKPGGMDDEIPF